MEIPFHYPVSSFVITLSHLFIKKTTRFHTCPFQELWLFGADSKIVMHMNHYKAESAPPESIRKIYTRTKYGPLQLEEYMHLKILN